jgi:uncharacterized membrane protein
MGNGLADAQRDGATRLVFRRRLTMIPHIRNPIEWAAGQIAATGHAAEESSRLVVGAETSRSAAPPMIRRITVNDLRASLVAGLSDFAAGRTDVVLLFLIYPVVGLLLAQWVFGNDMLPLLFPLASGFALVGPAAAVGLYEISRRREMGVEASWVDAFSVVASPRFGPIVLLGLLQLGIFALWILTAQAIYQATLGPEAPASLGSFLTDVLTTPAGWTMIVVGIGAGFLFALVVFTFGVVSFPLLLDRDVGLQTAVVTSVRAVLANPKPMAVWGLIVAISLAVGSLPLFLGLAIVVPVLGHATWHLYRRVVK